MGPDVDPKGTDNAENQVFAPGCGAKGNHFSGFGLEKRDFHVFWCNKKDAGRNSESIDGILAPPSSTTTQFMQKQVFQK